jgi:hypothetical protein
MIAKPTSLHRGINFQPPSQNQTLLLPIPGSAPHTKPPKKKKQQLISKVLQCYNTQNSGKQNPKLQDLNNSSQSIEEYLPPSNNQNFQTQ